MRRFSISKLMLVIAFLAVNFGVLRFLLSPERGPEWLYEVLAGLVPLGDSALLAAYLLVRRNRVGLRRRPKDEPGRFAVPFLASVATILLLAALSSFFAPEPMIDLITEMAKPVESIFKALGANLGTNSPTNRFVVGPIFLGVTLSAPLMLIAAGIALAWSRFQLIVTPRTEEPCADSPSCP